MSERKKKFQAITGIAGIAVFLFFCLFQISVLDVPPSGIKYSLITDFCGYAMFGAMAVCATLSICLWLDKDEDDAN